MTTSLIEMLELPNLGHMTTSVGDVMDRNYDAITFILKYRYFKNTWGSHFCSRDVSRD